MKSKLTKLNVGLVGAAGGGGIDGITYGTHPLGVIMEWLGWDRITRVCGEGSGHHHLDPAGKEYAQDTSGLISQASIRRHGQWLEVPDSRNW